MQLSGESLTPKFRFEGVNFYLSEEKVLEDVYHDSKEITEILNNKIKEYMKKEDIFTEDQDMHLVVINAYYERLFFPFLDALAMPGLAYDARIYDDQKQLLYIPKVYRKEDFGFFNNLKIIGTLIRDKEDEMLFIEKLAEFIVLDLKYIKDLYPAKN